MKRFLKIILLTFVGLTLFSCDKADKKSDDKVPQKLKEEELRDSTRLDSAVDTTPHGSAQPDTADKTTVPH